MEVRSGGDSRIAPTTRGSRPCWRATSVPNDQPSSHGSGRSAPPRPVERGQQVQPFAWPPSKAALAGPRRARRPAGVEAQHGQPGERGQPPRRLAQHVAVHHPAVRRQRMEADERGDRCADPRASRARRPGQARRTYEGSRGSRTAGSTVVERISVIVARGYPRARRRSRAAQHGECQWRRSPSRALSSSAGQATTCGVAGRISWSQPGQRYVFVDDDPVMRRTTQSPSGCDSTSCEPPSGTSTSGSGRRA